MEQNMFWKKTASTNILKVVIMIMMLTLLIFNSKPVEAAGPLVAVIMKSNKLETAKLVSASLNRGSVPPSEPNPSYPCTDFPLPNDNGLGCHH
nr:hypothetical protein CFP56_17136 [Quercus suber]